MKAESTPVEHLREEFLRLLRVNLFFLLKKKVELNKYATIVAPIHLILQMGKLKIKEKKQGSYYNSSFRVQ